jgi:ATP-dependent RNA helicase DOB1
MFGGVFNDLSVEQTVALLSCLVYEERSDDPVKLPEELAAPYRQLVGAFVRRARATTAVWFTQCALADVAKRVAQVMQDARVVVDMKEYLEKLRPNMMEVMYAWCRGAKFAQVCQMTNAFEGSIIRCIRRLEELLRQLASAAKAIGNADLEAKFNKGIEKIKRDIVFAASLYL